MLWSSKLVPFRSAFAPAQKRGRNRSVDGVCGARVAGEVQRRLADGQAKVGAREHLGLAGGFVGPGRLGPQAQAGDGTADRQSLDEATARQTRPKAGRFG